MTVSGDSDRNAVNDDLIFVNALGMKMIRVRAAAFDAWTPCFEDIWGKHRKHTGKHSCLVF